MYFSSKEDNQANAPLYAGITKKELLSHAILFFILNCLKRIVF